MKVFKLAHPPDREEWGQLGTEILSQGAKSFTYSPPPFSPDINRKFPSFYSRKLHAL